LKSRKFLRYVGPMQKQFLFEHEGCVLELQSCEHAGKWTAQGRLKFTDSSYEHLRVFTMGTQFDSAEQAFEKTKAWAVAEIESVL
jgi:hypothetical protein